MSNRLLTLARRSSPQRRALAPRPTRFRLRTADAGGPVAYADFGGEGPPIVLIHGLGGCHLNWLPAAPMLARHGRVLAIDLVGFGRTPRAGRSHGLEGQRAMLERFLDEVVREPAVILGNSLGGLIALMHAARRPDQVRALGLISPALPPSNGAKPRLANLARYMVQATPGLGELAMFLDGRRVGARGLFMELLTLGTKDVTAVPPEVVEANVSLIADRMKKSPFRHAQSYLDATRSMAAHLLVPGLVDRWARAVRSPVLVLHGAHDRIVPPAWSARLAEQHGFEREEMESAGHVPQMEDAPRFVEHVTGWLRRHAILAEKAAPSLRVVPSERAPSTIREAAPRSVRPGFAANDEAPASRAA